MTDTIDRAVLHTEWLVITNECQYDYSCRDPVLMSTRGSGVGIAGDRRADTAAVSSPGVIVGRTKTRFI